MESRNLKPVGDDARALEVVRKLGYSRVEDFKREYVEPVNVSRCILKYDINTKEIFVVSYDGKSEQPTGRIMPF